MSHGGYRKGAGRKPDPNAKVMVSKKLDRQIVAYLKAQTNATSIIENAIRKTKAFRDWVQSQ